MIPPIPLPRTARPGGYPTPGPFGGDFLSKLNTGLGRNSNALIALGSGLLRGKNFSEGLAYGGEGWMQGAQLDKQYRDELEEEEKLNTTEAYLRDNFPDLYEKYKAGAPMDAVWGAALKGDAQGFTLEPGQVRYDGNGNIIAEGPEMGTSAYAGTSMDAQNWNILLRATQDPSVINSPEYAAAYAQLTQPQVTYQQTENGILPVMETPQIPAWVQPPPGMAAPTQPSAATPSMSGAVPGSGAAGVTTGAVIPGTKKPQTEAENRIEMMATTIISEVPTFHQNVAAMDDMGAQLIAMGGPLANPWQNEEYQRAAQSVATSASQVLYALSGAAAGDAETEKRIKELTPQFGDKPGTIADKIRRFDTYVMTLANGSGNPEVVRAAQEALRMARGPAGPPMPPGGVQQPLAAGEGWKVIAVE